MFYSIPETLFSFFLYAVTMCLVFLIDPPFWKRQSWVLLILAGLSIAVTAALLAQFDYMIVTQTP